MVLEASELYILLWEGVQVLERDDSLLASLLLDSLPTWSVASSDLSLSASVSPLLDVDADLVSENIGAGTVTVHVIVTVIVRV